MKKVLLALSLLAFTGNALANDIAITASADYYDAKIIQSNIKNECVQLGSQFSEATTKALTDTGWSVTKQAELNGENKGLYLKLEILNALSAGNAFLGHKKSVSIQAELYKDGKLIDSYEATRSSSGGIGGGFKGSCAVLQRCVTTLGKDVSKWLQGVTI